MKKIAITLMMAAVSMVSFAQSNAITEYFSDFESQEDFTKVNVTGKMFEMTLELEGADADEQALLDALSNIEGLTLIGTESTENAVALFEDAISRPGNDFEVLMTVDDKDGNAVFYVREDNGVIAELLVIARGENEFGVATIWGEIDLRQVRKLTDAFSVAGMDRFDEEKAVAAREISVYPNPISQGSAINVTVPESVKGGMLEILDLNGRTVKTANINSTQESVSTAGLNAGTYVVVLKQDNAKLYSERIVITK
ncbi:MAG: hypothetical protein ACI84C_000604 [Flavobacteriales bacterium]|jgi:hypothetical protein